MGRAPLTRKPHQSACPWQRPTRDPLGTVCARGAGAGQRGQKTAKRPTELLALDLSLPWTWRYRALCPSGNERCILSRNSRERTWCGGQGAQHGCRWSRGQLAGQAPKAGLRIQILQRVGHRCGERAAPIPDPSPQAGPGGRWPPSWSSVRGPFLLRRHGAGAREAAVPTESSVGDASLQNFQLS